MSFWEVEEHLGVIKAIFKGYIKFTLNIVDLIKLSLFLIFIILEVADNKIGGVMLEGKISRTFMLYSSVVIRFDLLPGTGYYAAAG